MSVRQSRFSKFFLKPWTLAQRLESGKAPLGVFLFLPLKGAL
jgi:hypothetical protein